MKRRMSERRGKGLNEWMWNAEDKTHKQQRQAFESQSIKQKSVVRLLWASPFQTVGPSGFGFFFFILVWIMTAMEAACGRNDKNKKNDFFWGGGDTCTKRKQTMKTPMDTEKIKSKRNKHKTTREKRGWMGSDGMKISLFGGMGPRSRVVLLLTSTVVCAGSFFKIQTR